MSRLIVKNLPAYITPVLLKEHFSQSKGPGGTITDAKVAHKQDGTARRFGFIGFKTDEEALKAKEWYDKTFIGSTRVRVEIIDGAKDAPAPRPSKRPRLDTTAENDASSSLGKSTKSGRKSAADASPAQGRNKDAVFDEFMEVMQPKTKKGPSWADDSGPVSLSKKGKAPAAPEQPEGSLELEAPQQDLSDLEWMRRRMKQGVDEAATVEKAFEQSDNEEHDEQPEEVAEGKDPTEETILSTARLFVRNLSFTCTEEELRELFQPFGTVSQVHLPIDSVTKQPKGLAFVAYAQPPDALAAFKALDRKSFQGRLLHIMGAVDRNGGVAAADSGKSKTVREQRSDKRKASAGKEFNWSMLYMNSDAVLSSVADRMSISKSDILDPESSSAAVKLALAETHVIQETKAYFESHGVILSAFEGRGRSDTIILVKNIPYGTTAEQLRDMFGTHGELHRVLVPPAGTLAVVEFVHVDEARSAFRALAYRRLGNSVIYLEKGPLGLFQPTTTTTAAADVASGVAPITVDDDAAGADAEPDVSAGTTLFVKNLAFATTAERFTAAFTHLPGFAFARVQTKPDPKRAGARLSMGFGFVGFRSAEAARRALKGMAGHVLDGHALSVKFAGRGAEEERRGGKEKARTTKMLVKNVPFEATRKDIQELFGAHGQLKSVRLPKRFDRRSRGFAFLEFVTRHEAENAYNALRHTHLLGRHLVLEWAEEGGADIETLRKKAGVGFGAGAELPGRKRKLVLDDEEDEGAVEDVVRVRRRGEGEGEGTHAEPEVDRVGFGELGLRVERVGELERRRERRGLAAVRGNLIVQLVVEVILVCVLPLLRHGDQSTELDHAERLADVRDLVLEPAAALRQIAVHVAVLSVPRSAPRTHIAKRGRGTHARASWNALRTRSTATSGPPTYSSTSFCGRESVREQTQAGAESGTARRTMKSALGIPRGFLSSCWMMLAGGGADMVADGTSGTASPATLMQSDFAMGRASSPPSPRTPCPRTYIYSSPLPASCK
ncbi:hypothetical protein BC834DRAFT_841474 [Gloeopeniophorella convolvens]|nr:hypothetical protein BC834DRAFT_841474 [Gloeopeniophorella convolvens]